MAQLSETCLKHLKIIPLFPIRLTPVLFFLSILWVQSSHAMYSRGDVNRQINYSELQVVYRNANPWKISGYLVNRTGMAIDFSGELYLDDYFDKHTAMARISEKIPAWGKVFFSEYLRFLGDRGFSDSKVTWVVNRPRPESEPVPGRKAEPEKGYSTKRQLQKGYQFSGSGSELTDTFYLESGMLKIKASNSGEDGHFYAELLDRDGKRCELLANWVGSKSGSNGINVRNSGNYYIKVGSRGSWRLDLEMPDLPGKDDSESSKEPAFSGESAMYTIHMKNGQVISVDQYSDDGKTISFERFGAIVTLAKNKIKKIVKR